MSTITKSAVEDTKLSTVPYLTAEQLATPVLPEKDVLIPTLGGKVRIRAITRQELHDCREAAKTKDGKGAESFDDKRLEMYLTICGVVNPPLTEASYGHLLQQNSAAIQTMFNAVAELGGLNDQSLKDAEARFLEGFGG